MRLFRRLGLAALLAAPASVAGCELTPDLGSSEIQLREGQTTLDDLQAKMDKCRDAMKAYEESLRARDEAAARADRRQLLVAQGKMKDKIALVQARKPEFQDRALQARFVDEIRHPWTTLSREVDDLLAGRRTEAAPADGDPAPAK